MSLHSPRLPICWAKRGRSCGESANTATTSPMSPSGVGNVRTIGASRPLAAVLLVAAAPLGSHMAVMFEVLLTGVMVALVIDERIRYDHDWTPRTSASSLERAGPPADLLSGIRRRNTGC
mgnify:CR=1 FL=1